MVRKLSELSGNPEEGTFFTTPMGVLFVVLTSTIHDYTHTEFKFRVKFVGRLIDGVRLGLNLIYQTSTGWDLLECVIPPRYTNFSSTLLEKEQHWIKMLDDKSKSAQEEAQGSGGAAVAAPVAEAGPAPVAKAGPAPARINTGGVDTLGKEFEELRRGNQVVLEEGRAMVASLKPWALNSGIRGVILELQTQAPTPKRILFWWMGNMQSGLRREKNQLPIYMLQECDQALEDEARPVPAADSAAAEEARRPRRAAKRAGAGAAAEAVPAPVAETAVKPGSGEAGNPIVIDD